MKKLILASTSSTRKRLLTEAGLVFDIDSSSYEEDMSLPLPPKELAMYLSRGKAESVAKNYKHEIVIGADTFVVYDNKIFGKPHTPERARETLKTLSGQQHSIITGFTIIDTENDKTISRAVESKVFFRNLTDEEIDEYIASGEPLKRAGAYSILENGGKFIEKIEGSKSNIAGLPMEELQKALEEFDV